MKKFDQYVSHLRILSRAFDEDLTNDFIVSGIIDKYYIQFELGWKVLKNCYDMRALIRLQQVLQEKL